MKSMRILATIIAAAALAACGSSSSESSPPPPYTGFVRPAGAIAVNFTVDDTANRVYAPGDLLWKGSMSYNPATRLIISDTNWSGKYPLVTGAPLSGWAPLMDDGPWTVSTTAHEPSTNVAGDHKFGVTIFVVPNPAGGLPITIDYGLIDKTYEVAYGNGWIWTGPNGQFVVPAGATADVNAAGLVIPAFGDRDLQLQIDTSAVDASVTGLGTTVGVKGSAWAWGVVDISASKAGSVYSFTFSDHIGAGKQFNHTGLLHQGNQPEFIFTFDAMQIGTTSCCASGCDVTSPCEYKYGGNAGVAGVSGGTRTGTTGAFASQPVNINSGNHNTYVTVP